MIQKPSLPVQLLLVIAFSLFVGNSLPSYTAQMLFTFSMIFKEFLMFFLPAIIFSFILSGILSFKRNAPVVLLVLFALIIISNICVSMTSFSLGKLFLSFLIKAPVEGGLVATTTIESLTTFALPKIIGADKAMITALGLGIGFSYFSVAGVAQAAHRLKATIEYILNTLFIPLLPLYVLGFLVKLVQEGTIYELFSSYSRAFLLVLAIQALCSSFAYFLAATGNVSQTFFYMKNSFTAYLTAFSTMSSTAAVPVTARVAAKNTGNAPLSNIAIPIMANVHLMGDAVTVPIFALVTLSMFGGAIPTVSACFLFTLYLCTAMLATSGVPGGGIIVVIPFLQSILGFTPEMVSVITALYLLQDSFGTACNVFGDGALTIMADKILKRIGVG